MLHNCNDLENCILQKGFLPFFCNDIDGFSIEEMTPGHLWFSAVDDGPWEWKGPVLRNRQVAYGKFYHGKAMFVSLQWLPDFINYRRSLPRHVSDDKAMLDDIVLQTIESQGTATIKELRRLLTFARGRRKRQPDDLPDGMTLSESQKISLDPILTRLQRQGHLVISDFEYNIDRHGNRYGWGVARYASPETLYGRDIAHADGRTPEESHARLTSHLNNILPSATTAQIAEVLG